LQVSFASSKPSTIYIAESATKAIDNPNQLDELSIDTPPEASMKVGRAKSDDESKLNTRLVEKITTFWCLKDP